VYRRPAGGTARVMSGRDHSWTRTTPPRPHNRSSEGSRTSKNRIPKSDIRSITMLVDHTWQNPNRIPAPQGPIVTLPAVRRRLA
jgi:hypothetical protein